MKNVFKGFMAASIIAIVSIVSLNSCQKKSDTSNISVSDIQKIEFNKLQLNDLPNNIKILLFSQEFKTKYKDFVKQDLIIESLFSRTVNGITQFVVCSDDKNKGVIFNCTKDNFINIQCLIFDDFTNSNYIPLIGEKVFKEDNTLNKTLPPCNKRTSSYSSCFNCAWGELTNDYVGSMACTSTPIGAAACSAACAIHCGGFLLNNTVNLSPINIPTNLNNINSSGITDQGNSYHVVDNLFALIN